MIAVGANQRITSHTASFRFALRIRLCVVRQSIARTSLGYLADGAYDAMIASDLIGIDTLGRPRFFSLKLLQSQSL